MPTHKIEILGSIVEINYEEGQKNKLLKVIDQFKNRLLEYQYLAGKISDKKIIFLAALKAEDQVDDLFNQISKNEEQTIIKNDLSKEIIILKDKISELNKENIKLKNLNSKALDELDRLEKKIFHLMNNIISNK